MVTRRPVQGSGWAPVCSIACTALSCADAWPGTGEISAWPPACLNPPHLHPQPTHLRCPNPCWAPPSCRCQQRHHHGRPAGSWQARSSPVHQKGDVAGGGATARLGWWLVGWLAGCNGEDVGRRLGERVLSSLSLAAWRTRPPVSTGTSLPLPCTFESPQPALRLHLCS